MRCALIAAILPALLSAADIHIDHVTVAGANIKGLQERLSAIGIPSVYGGPHSNQTTEMALVSLPDGSYLELMGIQATADPQRVDQHEWARFLKANAGPCAWAVREPDIPSEVKRLLAAGISVAAPVKSGRLRPDGVRLEWQTSDISGGIRGTFFPFLIQDFTPRDQRAFPQGKPSTQDFKGIAKVVIGVRNLDDAIQRYRKAYNVPAPTKQIDKPLGLEVAVFSGTPVVLAAPLANNSWLTERLKNLGEAPIAFVLTASDSAHYSPASHSQWNGVDISWFDETKLGWRLGFEK
jgi:hypothetical protein